jgi:folate-dependent phosphoribosylglycinamide formyltransferase PurN
MSLSVVLLTRALPTANALVRRLASETAIDLIVCEAFPPSPRRSIPARILRRVRNVVEPGSANAMANREARAIERVFGALARPLEQAPPIEQVPNKGWEHALPMLNRVRPDVVAVYGTSILPASIITRARIAAVNLHLGLAPYYRGNHCVEFAFLNDDVENIGASLHLVTERIDGGPIIAQARPVIDVGDDLRIVESKVHAVAHRLLADFVGMVKTGSAFSATSQAEHVGRYYSNAVFTPGHRRLAEAVAKDAIARSHARTASGGARMVPIVDGLAGKGCYVRARG